MKTLTLTLLLIVSSLSLAAQAGAERGVVGAGATSCGQYVKALSDSRTALIALSWAQGFLSGINLTSSAVVGEPMIDLPDAPSVSIDVASIFQPKPQRERFVRKAWRDTVMSSKSRPFGG